jgi:hypothetical protein
MFGFLVIALGLLTGGQAAIALDGNELLKKCKDPASASQAFCVGYITGISDILESKTDSSIKLVCRAADIGPDQLRRVVLKYLRDRTVNRVNAEGVVGQALMESFPCKKEQNENAK